MSIIFKKKSKSIFANNSQKKGSVLKNKVDKIINETIEYKIFDLLNINKKVYVKLVEYFPIYTFQKETSEKTVFSYMLRLKSSIDPRFNKISAKEIELSGISMIEFENYLIDNGAFIIKNKVKIEAILNQI